MAQDRQPERREPPGHGSANRGRGRWGLLPAWVAVVLVGLVAVGSLRGPLGSGRGRPSYPADLIDSLLLLLFLAMRGRGGAGGGRRCGRAGTWPEPGGGPGATGT